VGTSPKNCATDAGENKPKEGDVKGEGRAGGAGGEEKLRACVSVTCRAYLSVDRAKCVDCRFGSISDEEHITNRKDWLSDFSECDGDVLTGRVQQRSKGVER